MWRRAFCRAAAFAEWRGVNSHRRGARLHYSSPQADASPSELGVRWAEQVVGRGQSRREGSWGRSGRCFLEGRYLRGTPAGWLAPGAKGWDPWKPRGSKVGVGWGGTPVPAGRGPACFVPVGTWRPQPAEWAGAGQRFSSLRGVCSATFLAPRDSGAGARAGCPLGALGKGRSPGQPLPAPLEVGGGESGSSLSRWGWEGGWIMPRRADPGPRWLRVFPRISGHAAPFQPPPPRARTDVWVLAVITARSEQSLSP